MEECKVLKEYSKKYAAKRPKKIKKPTPESNISVVILSGLTAKCRRSTVWNPMMKLYQ